MDFVWFTMSVFGVLLRWDWRYKWLKKGEQKGESCNKNSHIAPVKNMYAKYNNLDELELYFLLDYFAATESSIVFLYKKLDATRGKVTKPVRAQESTEILQLSRTPACIIQYHSYYNSESDSRFYRYPSPFFSGCLNI